MPSVTAAADREQIVIGVDTHKDTHVAVALTAQGAFVDTLNFASTSLGIGQVMRWAAGLGEVTAWGVEGTGSYGAGLARALLAAGRPVIDVNHANRAARHVLGGKTDRIDAEAAARSVLTTTPPPSRRPATGRSSCCASPAAPAPLRSRPALRR